MADGPQTGFLSSEGRPGSPREPRSALPWIVAGAVVVAVLVVLIVAGRRPAASNPGGAGLAAADPYAKSLPLTNIKMSESTNLLGAKQTYIDGNITNNGSKTVTGVTVQVAFTDFTNRLGQKDTMPLRLIRTREPSVDTVPVSTAPIAPGQTRDFRLIFDHVTDGWNQNYPEIRVIGVEGK
jgi:hypothetical protein